MVRASSSDNDWLMVCHVVPASDVRATHVRLKLELPSGTQRQLLDEIVFISDESDPLVTTGADLTPFAVKKALQKALDEAGVRILSAAVATDVLRDSAGDPAGVIIANRSGRQAVAAKLIIDCTENAVVAQCAGAAMRPFVAGDYVFSRMVIADSEDAPSAPGMTVSAVTDRLFLTSISGVSSPAGMQSVITGRLFRCTFTNYMATGSIEEILEVEQTARDLTWTSTCIDQADRLVWLPSDTIVSADSDESEMWTDAEALKIDAFRPAGVPFMYVLSAHADISRGVAGAMLNPGRALAMADIIGEAAAADALARGDIDLEELSVPAAAQSGQASCEIGEILDGFASKDNLGYISEGACDVPVIDTCDVLVVGAGTAGAPAAIAAARAGAETIVVDILYTMGGVMTDGRIGVYWYGNNVGFTKNDIDPGWKSKGSALYTAKSEWFRSAARTAGARILYGTLANGVLLENGSVKGAVVVLPDGTRGIIKAHTIVDSTGNSEIIQAAGAPVTFINSDELAVQGCGWAINSLGNSYQNSDLFFVNDMDPTDLTYTFRRVNASLSSTTWDVGRNPASRERHRVKGAFTINPIDILNARTYDDTIVVSRSDFDTHGFTIDDVFFLYNPGKGVAINANVPFRALLPEMLNGVLVTGLGVSAHRDSMPILRMQPDVQNQGYAAGYAAAMAANAGINVRDINIEDLQAHLVSKGILTQQQADSTESFPVSAQAVSNAVLNLSGSYATLPAILADTNIAIPLLNSQMESTTDQEKKIASAAVLGLLGQESAGDVLSATISGMGVWDTGWNYKGMGQFGRSVSTLDGYIIGAGRTGNRNARSAIQEKAELLSKESTFSHQRSVSLSLENLGAYTSVQSLSGLLEELRDYSVAPDSPPQAIYAYSNTEADKERNFCLKELTIARALYRLGDNENSSAKAVLEAYANDPRGLYATYARSVLAEGNALVFAESTWVGADEHAYWDETANWSSDLITFGQALVTNDLAFTQTIDLDGTSAQLESLLIDGAHRIFTNGVIRFSGYNSTIDVASALSVLFEASLECGNTLKKTGSGTLVFSGGIDLEHLAIVGGTVEFNVPKDESQNIGLLSGNISGTPVVISVEGGDLFVSGIEGDFIKTGSGNMVLSCPDESDDPAVSGHIRVAEGVFKISGTTSIVQGDVPCPSFESSPLLPSTPVSSMDKRGTAATGCAGWTFVNGNRFAGYQRNGSYFSSNNATLAPDGVQTAMIGRKGSMFCTFTVPEEVSYTLYFLSNSRHYGGTWYLNEPLDITVDDEFIGRVTVDSKEWVENALEIGVLTPGEHTLHFQGDGGDSSDPCALIDMVRVEGTGLSGSVENLISDDLRITISGDSAVELDYSGQLTIGRLTLDGQVYTSGTFDAASHPDIFTGTGKIVVKPQLTLFIVK